ncbi:MAG: DUF4907 domain-containing protein, partial [Chitinophagaceae bacterium]
MNVKLKILVVSLTGLILAIVISCNSTPVPKNTNQESLHITSEAIQINGGWGYKIDVNNHPFIYQSQIPCI